MLQNASKLFDRFWLKIRSTLGHTISGTKCDIDNLISSADRGDQ